jgi:RNase H-fold protein (predicted Holliday junction resolvase)
MKIVAIDPGTRNMGLAVFEDNKLTHFDSYDLFEYVTKKKRTDYSYVVHEFIKKSPQIFNNVDVLLIENQMKAKFKVIAHSFRCFFFQQAIKVSPLAVRKKFKISTSNYKKNKKASIKFVQQFLSKTQLKRFETHKKKDDLSDAIIMIHWYLKTKK